MSKLRTRTSLLFGMVIAASSFMTAGAQTAADPYVGHFTSNSGMAVDLASDGGHYTGVIHFNKTDMPLTGDVVGGQLKGNFTTGGSSFPFAAQAQGAALTLTTGGKTYDLTNALPQQQQHATAPVAAASATSGQLTEDQIGQALDKYGKNTNTNNGATTFSLDISRGKWNINVIVSLSPNHSVIWISNHLSSVPDLGKASPVALANLLQKNGDIGPMFFSMVGESHSLMLSNPVPNHDLTAEALQAQVDALVNTVTDTEPLWSPDTLVAK